MHTRVVGENGGDWWMYGEWGSTWVPGVWVSGWKSGWVCGWEVDGSAVIQVSGGVR